MFNLLIRRRSNSKKHWYLLPVVKAISSLAQMCAKLEIAQMCAKSRNTLAKKHYHRKLVYLMFFVLN